MMTVKKICFTQPFCSSRWGNWVPWDKGGWPKSHRKTISDPRPGPSLQRMAYRLDSNSLDMLVTNENPGPTYCTETGTTGHGASTFFSFSFINCTFWIILYILRFGPAFSKTQSLDTVCPRTPISHARVLPDIHEYFLLFAEIKLFSYLGVWAGATAGK